MPKAKAGTKVVQRPKTAPSVPSRAPDRPVLYPTLNVCGIEIPESKTRLSYKTAGDILGWETEEEYKQRVGPDSPLGLIGYGDDFLLLDTDGNKVKCWNNGRNRDLDEAHANKIAQDILDRHYKMNGETIIVGRTGLSLSAQHRLVGFRLAVQRWLKNPLDYPKWEEEPYINSLVVFGIDESPEVVKTLDNVRPRSDADVIYTSGVFDTIKVPDPNNPSGPYITRPSTKSEKKECSRMYAAATAFLWNRTRAGGEGEDRTYQTHSASDDFRARHPKLLEAVKHIFEENQDRAISRLRLSPGVCAAALYMMASGESDHKKYYANPGDKSLKFTRWDKAEEFFTDLAKGADAQPIRNAIAELVSADDLSGGRDTEKMAVLAKAWEAFLAKSAVTEDDLDLGDCWVRISVGKDKAGNDICTRRLVDAPNFGGIDRGPILKQREEDDPEKRKAEAERIRRENAEEMRSRGSHNESGPSIPLVDQLMELRRSHPGKMLLFEGKDRYTAYGVDAKTLAKHCRLLTKHKHGMPAVEVQADAFDKTVEEMQKIGEKVAVVEPTPNGNVKAVRDLDAPKAATRASRNGKKGGGAS